MNIQDRFYNAHDKIRELLRNKKITQKALANEIGIAQPRVSKILGNKGSDRFNVEDYLKIAEYLDVSLDSLFGYEKDRVDKEPETMRDIIEALFELENIDFDICQINQQNIIGNEITGNWEANNKTKYYIKLNCDYLNDFLSEWKMVRDLTKKSSVFLKMYDSWKKGVLTKAEPLDFHGYEPLDPEVLERSIEACPFDGFEDM